MKNVKWTCYASFILALLMYNCSNPQSTKKFTIGFSQCTGGDAWRRQMLIAMQGELAFHPEIGLEFKDAENNNDRQIKDIQEFIDKKVDLLIVSPNEADPITPIVETAFQKGIPVIIIDRRTSSSMYSAYIGADNLAIGKLAGSYVAEFLKGKGSILEIWGRRGSSPAIDRHRGFIETLADYPDIKIIGEVNGQWELDTAKSQLKKSFDNFHKFDLVFAHNDVMAYGAYVVSKQEDPDNNIAFVGIDALPGQGGGIQFVDDKILDATFLYPTGGEEAIRIASLILSGQHFEKENILHSTVIDSKNVRVMKLQSDKILTQQKDIVRQQEKINEQINTYYSQRILIYILLASLILMIIGGAIAVISWREKNEINKRLEAKTKEIMEQRNTIAAMAEKAELATQEKLRFFTNISHEFKTPLTLIMGPIEELLSKGGDFRSTGKENLSLIRKNAVRLLRLVNQLMDFRKIEDKKMMVRASEADIIEFIGDVMAAFEKISHKRKIDFRLISDIKQVSVWFDPDMLDKVIFNLLSNAFKFTNDKGRIHITVSIDNGNKNILILVEDNGIGMSQEYLNHAFDRFYTGENLGGTGIGLSLSKEFIELHHGQLILSSEKGKGTRFCIMLPLGKAHFEEYQLVSDRLTLARKPEHEILADDTNFIEATASKEVGEEVLVAQKDNTILLIDDNAELRNFIKGRLQAQYNIVEAQDGLTGLHLAYEVVPDVIICDVMLPGKDGFEVSKTLKSDLRTSHIPVIILTAKGSIEQRITGVQTGADEYITKPFVFEYLNERIKSLIKNRENLKEHYSQDLNIEPSIHHPGGLDKKFINDFMAFVEKNISNADFNVNEIGRELGMSRVQVYRKVKALLGYSVNDYIVNVRLKKAKHLLLHSEKSISEISSEVGFSSPTYFSTTFKSKFHVSPKDFKASQIAES
jgi:signal transduction histidine kinase/DNA-binding response OmpR family regulator/ABC-type xylose transport system substrate-binding protein